MAKVTIEQLEISEFISIIKSAVKDALKEIREQDKEEKLLSPEVARKLFNPTISKVTLHRWTQDGRLPVYRLGGRIYYRESEVIEAAKSIRKYIK